MTPIILIDLSAEFWRNYHGTGSAVGGYELTIERVEWYIAEYPGSVVVCCDSPKSKRKEADPTYKANRKPRPEDGIGSIQAVEARVRSWGVPVAKCEGYEADDLIATLTDQAWPRDVHIIGAEKDFYCLICDSVWLATRAGLIDADGCVRKFGVPPEQMTELLAMTGDASDNIKGCDGIGLVKAQAILQAYSSIAVAQLAAKDGSMKLPGIGPKLIANLAAWDPTAALAMVRLMRDAPVNLDNLLAGVTDDDEPPF